MKLHLNDREDGNDKAVYCVGCGERLRTFNMLVCADCLSDEHTKIVELSSSQETDDNEL